MENQQTNFSRAFKRVNFCVRISRIYSGVPKCCIKFLHLTLVLLHSKSLFLFKMFMTRSKTLMAEIMNVSQITFQ